MTRYAKIKVHTVDSLIKFEAKVANLFNNKEIRAPIHLSSGNEEFLIEFFAAHVKSRDWIFSSWRSHYHCLLKGVSEEALLEAIRAGRSISLCFKDQKVFSSAIVGGCIPIAVGVAEGITRQGGDGHVFCFIGDMTSETGIAFESIKYAENKGLPITFVLEDNGLSVCSDTLQTWQCEELFFNSSYRPSNLISMRYRNLRYPHAGSGTRVEF